MTNISIVSMLEVLIMKYLKKLTFIIISFIFISQFLYSEDKSKLESNPNWTVLNINEFEYWVKKDGSIPALGHGAGLFPHGINVIYIDGLVWCAKTHDGIDPILRAGGSTYISGLKAGKVLFDGAGKVIGSESPNDQHIWRVREDYKTADLTNDAASFFQKSAGTVSATDKKTIYDQYEYDWQNWPANKGAPYKDINEDGKYEPDVDIPGHPSATQTIWTAANDLPYDNGIDISFDFAGAPPIGIEMQLTVWAVSGYGMHGLSSTVFKDYKLIYTGLPTTPDTARIDTMYLTQYVDPDIGTYTDDFAGWDHDRMLGYAYNSQPHDATYDQYGLLPPAVGYTFLQRPKINGVETPLSSFFRDGAGNHFSTPNIGIYEGTLQWYNAAQGYVPTYTNNRQSFIDPTTGEPTKFTHYGDPLTGEGWVDGTTLGPGERQFYISCGPFEMALGDTQNVTIAIIGARTSDYLINITVLKYFTDQVRWMYDNWILDTEEARAVPASFSLLQNYPNPFNPMTTVRYNLPETSIVEISIYNILGKKISTIVNETQQAGVKEVIWNGTDDLGRAVSAGIYIYQIRAGKFIESRKMVLMR